MLSELTVRRANACVDECLPKLARGHAFKPAHDLAVRFCIGVWWRQELVGGPWLGHPKSPMLDQRGDGSSVPVAPPKMDPPTVACVIAVAETI